MAAVIFRSPPIACLSQNHLKLLDRPSQACVNNSFRSGDSTPINLRYERPVSQTQTQTHLSARGHKARNITSKAYQTDTQQTSSSATRTKESNGWAWVLGGLTLTSGTSAPALYIGSHWNEITQMAATQRTAGIAAADAVFILAASTFFFCGHQFGLQRNGKTVRFPGPMVELDGRSRTPDFFLPYVSFIILGTILVPSAALGLLIKDGNADLGFSTVGVYLLCLIVQIASESIALRTGTPMWVQVPQAYQPFRLYQLARGLALSSAVGGPAWLQTLQGFLVVTWVFNYGAQMQFTPWLYRWHLQPTDTK